MKTSIITVQISHQQDIVNARQRARNVAALLGFEAQDQSRIATAVSEISRNALQYGGGGKVEFTVDETNGQTLNIIVRDAGPGIADLASVLDGSVNVNPGRGRGIMGVRRLMDRFHVESSSAGTIVKFDKRLPKRMTPFRPAELSRIAAELSQRIQDDPFEEMREQNRELLRVLEELRQRQVDLAQANQELQRRETELSDLNRELEDTNRGVVSLYAELEERAEFLGRASEMKSRFLSNMSHEFRTPLNAIHGLTRLLMDRADGPLTSEQETQVSMIRRAIESLTELVNDLLDLAKVEAGKVVVRANEFRVDELFSGLRGMLRPLLSANSSVDLIFETPETMPVLTTDENKVSQILRNFISNALKFTERGEIRVSVRALPGETVVFSVADTGIGIAPEDQTRIFEEFTQVEGSHQKRVKGTGLGLPLVKRLTELLGGHISLKSVLGQGSTFSATLPIVYHGPTEPNYGAEATVTLEPNLDPSRRPLLVVEDNKETLFIYEKYLKGTDFQVVPAQDLRGARHALTQFRPFAILLDVLLGRESGWDLLTELKASESTRDIPVMVLTVVENEAKAMSLGADAFYAKPVERAWLLAKLATFSTAAGTPKILIIDDDSMSRYLVRESIKSARVRVLEAATAEEGMHRTATELPRLVILDLDLPDRSGYDVLSVLRSNPATAQIPVIINTARVLAPEERDKLIEAGALTVLSKEGLAFELGLAELRTALHRLGLTL
jgi:signal transduction histidine kinase/CheY-like chemotaxis protein